MGYTVLPHSGDYIEMSLKCQGLFCPDQLEEVY